MPELVGVSGEAAAIVSRMYQLNPAWLDRAVKRGPRSVRQDVQHHLDFLGAAAEGHDPELFAAYTDWMRRVEEGHGMSAEALAATYEIMADVVGPGARRDLLLHNIPRLRSPPVVRAQAEASDPRVAALTEALLAGDQAAAAGILSATDGARVADELVQPAMEEIGRLWETTAITVAKEHLATATCRAALASLGTDAKPAPTGGRAVLACIEGNRHSIGLSLLADRLRQVGWDTQLLGADVPLADLVAHVREHKPDLVCLSLALPGQLVPARHAVEALRRAGAARVVVGGRLVRDYPETGRLTGADLWPNDVAQAMRDLR